MNLRWSPQLVLLLVEFTRSPLDWKYGYEISRTTGVKSGTLYPLLIRLAARGLLETNWEPAEPGKPPRHLYRLTGDGMRFAREQASSTRKAVHQPELCEVKSR